MIGLLCMPWGGVGNWSSLENVGSGSGSGSCWAKPSSAPVRVVWSGLYLLPSI